MNISYIISSLLLVGLSSQTPLKGLPGILSHVAKLGKDMPDFPNLSAKCMMGFSKHQYEMTTCVERANNNLQDNLAETTDLDTIKAYACQFISDAQDCYIVLKDECSVEEMSALDKYVEDVFEYVLEDLFGIEFDCQEHSTNSTLPSVSSTSRPSRPDDDRPQHKTEIVGQLRVTEERSNRTYSIDVNLAILNRN